MPALPWTPEFAVDENLAGLLIGDQFPALRPVTATTLGVGWDNTAFLVNGRFVFRFPRREVAAPLLETEARVLTKIHDRLPLPIPVPMYVGVADAWYPWTFVGYERLSGRTACAAGLTNDERTQLAEPLAQFLTALHRVRPEHAHWLGAPRDTWNRFDLGRKVPHTRERLAELHATRLIADPAPWLALVEEAPTLRTACPQALTHGDLYVRHLLVDDEARLCGVIDWGDIHIGDIAVDLAVVCALLPAAGRSAFRSIYPRADRETWRLARFHALYHACITTRYGHSIEDQDLVREGQWTLNNLLAQDFDLI